MEPIPSWDTPNEIRVLANRIESQHDFRVNQYVTLTAGYQFREQLGENETGISEKILSSHAGFGQMQLNLFDRFFATAGVRHDNYNTFGDATTYRVTGGYLVKETNTKIRSSYATGFRAPTINDLFWPNYGNPNVQPEKSQSFDVGVDQTLLAGRMTISGGYFWNRYRNLIGVLYDETICAPFSSFGSCAGNVASAKSQGWEGMVNIVLAQEQPWIKRLELRGQYTMTLTRDLMTGTRLARWPVDQAGLSLLYRPVDSLNMILDFRFVGSQFNNPARAQDDTERVDSFNVVNLAVNYDLSDQFQAYVRVDNLFDEAYEEILNYGTPGRSVFGGNSREFRSAAWVEHEVVCYAPRQGNTNMRISKVYTRSGDAGKTRLAGGQEVWKDSLRVEAYGTVDELNSVIGIARANQGETRRDLAVDQNKLFDLGGILATAPGETFKNMPVVTADHVVRLERLIDACQEDLEPLKEFILPGGGKVSGFLHQARTICRRAERLCVSLSREEEVSPELVRFLNRLSDALFVLARWVAKTQGEPEYLWERET